MTPEENKAEEKHGENKECGKVWLEDGFKVCTKGLEEVGECGDGCCTKYRCLACGKRFTVEWPD